MTRRRRVSDFSFETRTWGRGSVLLSEAVPCYARRGRILGNANEHLHSLRRQVGRARSVLRSAASVVKNLDPAKYRIMAIGIDKAGRWHLQESDRSTSAAWPGRHAEHRAVAPSRLDRPGGWHPLPSSGRLDIDCVVPRAARHVRRGRHDAGPARDRRPPLRRCGRARQRRLAGQGDREAPLARRRPADRRFRGRARGEHGGGSQKPRRRVWAGPCS